MVVFFSTTLRAAAGRFADRLHRLRAGRRRGSLWTPWQVLHSTFAGRPSTTAWTVCASVSSHFVQKQSTSPPTLTIGRRSIAMTLTDRTPRPAVRALDRGAARLRAFADARETHRGGRRPRRDRLELPLRERAGRAPGRSASSRRTRTATARCAVARALSAAGCPMLGVALVEEGMELREAGLATPILVFGGAYGGRYDLLVRHGLTPFVFTEEHLEGLAAAARAAGRSVPAHLKLDTGMGRIGLAPEELPRFLERARSLPEVRLEGLCTHFASADARAARDDRRAGPGLRRRGARDDRRRVPAPVPAPRELRGHDRVPRRAAGPRAARDHAVRLPAARAGGATPDACRGRGGAPAAGRRSPGGRRSRT